MPTLVQVVGTVGNDVRYGNAFDGLVQVMGRAVHSTARWALTKDVVET